MCKASLKIKKPVAQSGFYSRMASAKNDQEVPKIGFNPKMSGTSISFL